MLKLMKYEFRKTMFSKAVLLIITALAELAYLVGVFAKLEDTMGWGIVGLSMCAMIGIFYIGIESLIVFHKDLNTKQSYMLFLTPNSSYRILGAKIVENGIAIFAAGAFFAALAALDATIGILYIGGLKEFLDIMGEVVKSIQINIDIQPDHILMTFLAGLASWMMMIVTGYLAIVLSATVLAGKKFSGFVSFLIYLLISWISGRLMNLVPAMHDFHIQFGLIIAVAFVIILVMYAVTGWIMEKKLSV